MVEGDPEQLRVHEHPALDLYDASGREDAVLRARQALVLGVFLSGDYAAALELERLNLEAFRRSGAQYLVADSMTLQAGSIGGLANRHVMAPLAGGAQVLPRDRQRLRVRSRFGMAAIVLLADRDAELGARITGPPTVSSGRRA